jgi:hypothetical protein
MQAQRGVLFGEKMEEWPPEAKAEFLKKVQLLEDTVDKKPITMYECIGSPPG